MATISSTAPSHSITLDSFNGETVFITGCSGFLGKVILEKLMRSFSCKRIYVLIRTKKNKDTRIRFRSDILGSQIFHTLRKEKGDNFEKWASELVVPVAGDLLLPGVGISDSDRVSLRRELNVIIHSAASVDFDLPLEEATAINVDGSLAILDLAKECMHLRSLVHVSTCYVNSPQRGTVQERIYDSPFDVDLVYRRIKSSSSEELARDRAEIIGGWPNSYTLTKFLAEHLLTKRAHGSVPLVICRPAIISAALAEPVPGWTDCISAASAVFLAIGMGICPVMPGSMWSVGDVVPVDLCAHMIIAGTALAGPVVPPVVHCGSSSWGEPMTWFSAIDAVCQYFNTFPLARRVRAPTVRMVPNQTSFDIQRYLNNHLPQRIAQFMESVSGSKTLSQLARAIRQGDRVVDAFSYFTLNEWVFESFTLKQQVEVSPPGLLLANRVAQIDWFQYMYVVCYGMRKYCLGEAHAEVPLNQSVVGDALARAKVELINAQHPNPVSAWFAHIFWASNGVQMNYVAATHSALERGVMEAMALSAADAPIARKMLHSFGTKFDYTNTRFFGYTLQKVFANMYDRVAVNEDVLTQVKDADCPVLLIPTHRSYMDFLILSFILFAYHQKLPFIASGEDFQKIPGVASFLRKSGAFFMKRKLDPKTDPLYVAVFKAYFQQIILKHGLVEFFIEGGRSRTGCQLHPKFGLLAFAMELFFENKVDNLLIVPVSMSYERVLEAESFPRELLGERKTKESLSRLVSAVSSLGTKYGRAHVVLGEPISVNEWIQGCPNSDTATTVRKLGLHIGSCLESNLVIMSTHLVAAVLLANRHSMQISDLVTQVEILRNEVRDRGRIMEVPTMGTCATTVETCLKTHFEKLVVCKGESVEIVLGPENTLTLAYYRNQLMAVFAQEAFISVVLRAGPLSRPVLEAEVSFVAALCGKVADFRLVGEMVERGTLTEEKRGSEIFYSLNPIVRDRVAFVCSLVYPQIDTAWATAVAAQQGVDSQEIARTCDYEESRSLEAIKVATHAFVNLGLMEKNRRLTDPMLALKISKYRKPHKLVASMPLVAAAARL